MSAKFNRAADCPDPLPDATPVARVQSGDFNWRGGEGSMTDRVGREHRRWRNPNAVRYNAWTRPSTGLVYMQARFYEPATGRFTQNDPLPYQLTDLLTGQNNRWTYCGSDPVNASDPSGRHPAPLIVGLVVVAALLNGFVNWNGGGSFSAGAAGGAVGAGIAVIGGPWAALIGSGVGSGLTGHLNGNALDTILFDFVIGSVFGLLGFFGNEIDLLTGWLLSLDGSLVTGCVPGLRNF